MNLQEIKTKQQKLSEQIRNIEAEIELLNNKKEAVSSKKVISFLKGTNWFLQERTPTLIYTNNLTMLSPKIVDSDFEKFIFNDLGLWPHGATHISDFLILKCDDGTLSISVDEYNDCLNKLITNEKDHNKVYYETLFEFTNTHEMLISFRDIETHIKYLDKQVKNEEAHLEYIKSLYKTKSCYDKTGRKHDYDDTGWQPK